MKTNQLYYTTFSNGNIIKTTKDQVFEEIPESWIPIVNQLIDDMFDVGWDGRIDQVKEKFGSLRFYIPQSTKKINELIDEAELQTTKICLMCGEPATTHTQRGWFIYVCDDHRDKK